MKRRRKLQPLTINPPVVDLSHHNDVADFGKVKASGIAGIIHKATEAAGFADWWVGLKVLERRAADVALRAVPVAAGVAGDRRIGTVFTVRDEDNSLGPDWRMVRLGGVALLEKPADDRSPKRIDCYQVTEQRATGDTFVQLAVVAQGRTAGF